MIPLSARLSVEALRFMHSENEGRFDEVVFIVRRCDDVGRLVRLGAR
jgi:hypothetical protein